MKVMTLVGTRPEIIRLSQVIPRIDEHCDHVLVHTGQNYDPNLSDVFFNELKVRPPDVHLGVRAAAFAEQASQILNRVGRTLEEVRPDRVLILGDTNSGLGAIVAARMRIPVYHMEAGNRCYDDRVPEEINRRLIDHTSTVLMPYTERSKDNLVREGIARERIFVVGNPIYEVLRAHEPQIEASDVLSRLRVDPRRFFLVTLHRSENVDDPARLEKFFAALDAVAGRYRHVVVVSVHPRTSDKLRRFGISAASADVRLIEPLGFWDFVKLERTAAAVLSDSGTVQEECCIFGVPNVTLRDVTERPETVECGSGIISGGEPDEIQRALAVAMQSPTDWTPPAEYLAPSVSRTVLKILLGHTR
jgi:UDP-N-acetylglucosamine 2-epimerase (non-hydrolysing)